MTDKGLVRSQVDNTQQMRLAEMSKLYSRFKSRCDEAGVWSKYLYQQKICKDNGMTDWEAKNLLMPIWDGLLTWVSMGNNPKDWDFRAFRPVDDPGSGAFDTTEVCSSRKMSMHQMILESEDRREISEKKGTKESRSILSYPGHQLNNIEQFILQNPVENITRAEEVEWAYNNIYAYRELKKANKEQDCRELMESAPSYSACSWLEYADSNFTKFMTDLNKNLPPEDHTASEADDAEAAYMEVLSVMEGDFRVECPQCRSMF